MNQKTKRVIVAGRAKFSSWEFQYCSQKKNKNILRMQGEPQKGKDHKHRGYDPHGARNREEISQQGIKEEKEKDFLQAPSPPPKK